MRDLVLLNKVASSRETTQRLTSGLCKHVHTCAFACTHIHMCSTPPLTRTHPHTNEVLPKMIRGSSSHTAASRKSRNGAMIPPKSHKPEQSETPKFLQIKTYFQVEVCKNKLRKIEISRYTKLQKLCQYFLSFSALKASTASCSKQATPVLYCPAVRLVTVHLQCW